MTTANYTIYVDFDNDGILEEIVFLTPWFVVQGGNLEDVTSYVRSEPGIKTTRGRDQIRALGPPAAGRADMELTNVDKQFSPENTDSVLYGNLVPGRQVQVRATYGGTTYNLWTGYLDDIPQFPELSKRSVGLPSLGGFSKLAGQNVSTQVYQNITTDVALGHLLDAAGWSATARTLDTGKTTLAWWWLDNEDAFQAARALLNTEGPGAALYEDGSGNIVFESRHYRLTTARSTTAQATFADTGAEPKFLATPFSYNPALKDILNVAQITVKTRTAKSASVVWSLGQTVTLSPSEVRQYVATSSDPFTGAITPVNATDYTVSAGGLSSVTLSRTSGASTIVTLTAGSSGATVTGLQLRAQLVSTDNSVLVSNTVDTSASIAKYGRQVFALDTRAEIAANVAQDLVNAIVGLYQNPRPTVTFQVSNGHADRLTQILSRQISDRITITESQTVLSADFFIERIEHQVMQAGLHHITTFGCEKASNAGYAVWGTSLWGTGKWGF